MKHYDDVFKAYSEWIGAYHRRDKDEGSLRKRYFDIRDKLSQAEQLHWPV